MKEEALRLADELDKLSQYVPSEAPNMIRRLVEELDKLNGCLIAEQEHNEMLQTKPLSDEEILEVAKSKGWQGDLAFLIDFAKAILKKASEK